MSFKSGHQLSSNCGQIGVIEIIPIIHYKSEYNTNVQQKKKKNKQSNK